MVVLVGGAGGWTILGEETKSGFRLGQEGDGEGRSPKRESSISGLEANPLESRNGSKFLEGLCS